MKYFYRCSTHSHLLSYIFILWVMIFFPTSIDLAQAQCNADFTGSPTSGCAPLKVTFTDNSTGATSWSWTFAGGSPATATGKGPHLVTYNAAGSYDVALSIVCKQGFNSIKKSKYINVQNCACTANFYASPTSGCAPLKVTFTDNSSGAVSWDWTFPGGSPSTATGKGPHGVHYNTPGSYDVELKIVCKTGSDLEKKMNYIVVNDCNCKADFIGDPVEGCAPLQVEFTDKSTGAIDWWWTFPGGTPASASGAGPHTVKYNSPGSYTVSLEVTCKYGKDIISKPDYIKAEPCDLDFGDAPNHYGTNREEDGARHIVSHDVYLGKLIDSDPDGQPGPGADGDDKNNQDDEDGVSLRTPLVPGDTALVEIVASTNGMLKGWIDFNQDGNWNDPGELVLDRQISANLNVLPIIVPTDAKEGDTYARFRFSKETIMDWRGILPDGEVEDYLMEVRRDVLIPGEFGDAPEGVLAYPSSAVIGQFPTCRHVGPAGYIRHTALGTMFFGGAVDFELDGNAGACPLFMPNSYEQDEVTSPMGVIFGEDAGLEKPKSFLPRQSGDTLTAFTTSGGVYAIGQTCETVSWGRAIDMFYNTFRATTDGYINVLFDWDQNGQWGGGLFCPGGSIAAEHAVVNLRVPAGSTDRMSSLRPPDLKIGPLSGFVWARFVISETPVDARWDGSGAFVNGETEDYLLLVHPRDDYFDGGDAPEDQIAYPATGQIGHFPTCKGSGASGHIQHLQGNRLSLGAEPDLETNGNGGRCQTIRADEFNKDFDDALELLQPYTISYGPSGYRIVETSPYSASINSIGRTCREATWGTDLNMQYVNLTGAEAYLNVLIDWNQDGEWGGASDCGGGVSAQEHVVVNLPLETDYHSIASQSPPAMRIGPNAGYVWARFTISERRVEVPWHGAGNFEEGESEDYLLHVHGTWDLLDFGDAPHWYDAGSDNQTASHIVHPEIRLGAMVDAESAPEPSQDAEGDDKSGQDDEDGIDWKGELSIGDTVLVEVTTSAIGFLKGWIDFDQDGRWSDGYETVCDHQAKPGINRIWVPIPEDAKPGPTYARWRFSDAIIPGPGGAGGIGEIEDYLVVVFERLKFPYEFGDAPEGAIAYPDLGVVGQFPTCKYGGSAGFIQHGTRGDMYFGYEIDYELDGNGGSCPTFCGDFDNDEGLNEVRYGVYIYQDIGLTTPICYTIGGETCDYYHPHSIFKTRGVLGNNCEMAIWGENIDAVYHVKAEDGAYVNVLMDWDQDGTWGGSVDCPGGGSADEWVLRNFHIPKGEGLTGFGRLSDLTPPEFRIGPNEGYVWARFTITPQRIEGSFDGSGVFTDGETEDYLLCVSFGGFYDFGDAPENALAYPESGVMGRFPTCKTGGPAGFIRHDPPGHRYFGGTVDYEQNGNAGFCSAFNMHYDADENYYDSRIYQEMNDAGLRLLLSYRISGMAGMEFVSPYSPEEGSALATSLGRTGGMAVWGEDLDLHYTINERDPEDYAYLNVIIDWNQDGQWGGSSVYSGSGGTADEYVLQNFRVEGAGPRLLSNASPPSFVIGPNSGYVWARFTITKTEVPDDWDGSGAFADGESEDYLIYIEDAPMLLDFGDIPSWFNANQESGFARHAIHPGFCLGSTVDADEKEQSDDHALGDDHDGSDDEDGVAFRSYFSESVHSLELVVTSSGIGLLNVWLDVEGDSTWASPGDHILKDAEIFQGKNLFNLTLPDCTMIGTTYARVRLSQVGGLDYYDADSNMAQNSVIPIGEVEDYEVYLGPAQNGYDFGDAADPTFATLMASNGARHIIDPEVFLGNRLDSDADGQPDGDALGDDGDGIDDDDGVSVATPILPATAITIKVRASTCGYLNGWIDWNGDGDWFDAKEHPFLDAALIAGDNALTCDVPGDMVAEKMFARFRFSRTKGIAEQGMAPDGEVEDYRFYLTATGVETEPQGQAPEAYALLQNYPNPFNPQTHIEFHLPQPGEVRLSIFDIQGREVRRLLQGYVSAGRHNMTWNGRDTTGKLMPSGMYFYRLTVKDSRPGSAPQVLVKKLLLLK
ncbi:T9SS type A sorting domain-containing protein [candidate division KSB1 bacterium]|nr:T9SS type A sorting domain-containing protein [candidate division KSB1 bacterium]